MPGRVMTPPAPSHVLMTADTIGGVWTYALELCAGLKRLGVRVSMMTMGNEPDAEQRRAVQSLGNVSLIATGYRLEWMRDCEADLERSAADLLRLERELQPDIVHINGFFHAALPFRAPVLAVAHSDVATWWEACRGTIPPPEWDRYSGWVREALTAADMLVAPTAAYLADLERLHGMPRRARVIWNGRDSALFRPGPKGDIVLAAGRIWDEAKNIALLCRAAAGLDAEVAIAGDTLGPDGRHPPAGDVRLLGRISQAELARWMLKAGIFVAPARYEPFGLGILEAALSGCALVLSDIPSLRELWDDVALFVGPGDPGALRQALAALIADAPGRLERGRRARECALVYSRERMTEAYCDAYRTVVRPRTARPHGVVA